MKITLKEILDAREERVRIQKQMQNDNPYPLICFTMNIAGPIKTSPLIKRAFRYGLKALDAELKSYNVLAHRTEYQKSGPVSYYSIMGDAEDIKDICVRLEESFPMGRLFDMDVIDIGGKKLERPTERGCIICGAPGRVCAAGRLHSATELQEKTAKIITGHFMEKDCESISEFARISLLKEVQTTPKPGLVDLANSGSHTDMDTDTFEKSANALVSYFAACVKIGIETAGMLPQDTFTKLRCSGVKAEQDMYNATGGVNTHKGIIYSMGIILGAMGRLWKPDMPIADVSNILAECSALVKDSVNKDFANINGSTAGGRLYLLNGERGIRGEAADGFPSVKNIALPTYKHALKEGKNENDAGVITLLHLIAQIYDTSVFNRGGEDGVAYAREYAKRLLSDSPPTHDDIIKMDMDFINKNLSPGGAADLLAITYLLAAIEEERDRLIKEIKETQP